MPDFCDSCSSFSRLLLRVKNVQVILCFLYDENDLKQHFGSSADGANFPSDFELQYLLCVRYSPAILYYVPLSSMRAWKQALPQLTSLLLLKSNFFQNSFFGGKKKKKKRS